MEERLETIEYTLKTDLIDSEKIKEIVLASVKSQLEDWLNKTLTISCISEEIERRYKLNKSDMYECSKEIKRLERELEASKVLTVQNYSEICKINLLLNDILTDLRLKAYQGDLDKLNRQLDEKCSWDFAHQTVNSIKGLATVSSLETLESSLEDFKEKVSKEYEPRKDIFGTFEKLEKKMMGLMSGFISRDELRANSHNFSMRITDLNEEMIKVKREAKVLEDNLFKEQAKFRNDFSDCTRQFQLDRLKKELDLKTTKAEFSEFITENLPKISEYSLEFKRVNRFIEDQEKAIMRIDEVVCEKASKLDLKLLKESFNDFPAKQQGEAIVKLTDTVVGLNGKLEGMRKEMKDLFDNLQESGSNKISYDARLSLLKAELRELENRVTYKADTHEILEYLERKASWEDFSHISESIETVHMQTKILAAQIAHLLPNSHTKKASCQKKITKKLIDIVISSRPTTDDSPGAQLKSFVKFPPTPEVLKSRACTPHRRFTNFCNSLQT